MTDCVPAWGPHQHPEIGLTSGCLRFGINSPCYISHKEIRWDLEVPFLPTTSEHQPWDSTLKLRGVENLSFCKSEGSLFEIGKAAP